ncbi:MAG TPA: hypothetical protein VF331_13955 [Polyangiales bacterium]
MSDEALSALCTALESVQPQARSWLLAGEVRDRLGTIAGLDVDDAIRLLLMLYRVRFEQEAEPQAFVAAIQEAAEASGDERLKATPAQWTLLSSYLVRMLSLDGALGLTARAINVAYEFPRHLHDSRIMTDARPIYGHDVTEGPKAFLMMHVLRMTVHEDGEDREWHVALDNDDILKLQAVLERALAKEQSLSALLKKTNVSVLGMGDEE